MRIWNKAAVAYIKILSEYSFGKKMSKTVETSLKVIRNPLNIRTSLAIPAESLEYDRCATLQGLAQRGHHALCPSGLGTRT
jgi:hypothetical protein